MRKTIRGRGQQLLAAFLMGLILALLLGAEAVRAEESEEVPEEMPEARRNTMVGYDISWPQCDGLYPGEPIGFGIVGVTGGKPYTVNRCLQEQWEWTKQGGYPGEVYINVDYWKRTSYHHFFGPAGLCSPLDLACQAFNYGWNGAREAVSYGESQGVDAT
ncbi:MAG: hypothetical protein M0R74_11520, partial [Dehalococcoidia bacterium]|nr:hypothetical protein [Dehalococcoidia bacterium]